MGLSQSGDVLKARIVSDTHFTVEWTDSDPAFADRVLVPCASADEAVKIARDMLTGPTHRVRVLAADGRVIFDCQAR